MTKISSTAFFWSAFARLSAKTPSVILFENSIQSLGGQSG